MIFLSSLDQVTFGLGKPSIKHISVILLVRTTSIVSLKYDVIFGGLGSLIMKLDEKFEFELFLAETRAKIG
jgi:hypothetical protein